LSATEPLRRSEPYDYVVIGAGLAGLCTGALLARAGRRVLVCEKRPIPGGCCTSFVSKGYRFDLSVQSYSGCASEGTVGAILRHLGVADEIEFTRLDPAREYLFPDLRVLLPASLEAYGEQLCRLFPAESEGIARYLRLQEETFEEIRRLPDSIRFSEAGRFERDFPRLTSLRRATLAEVLADFISDKRLRAVLAVRSSYFALSPSRASFIAVANMEMNYFREGVYVARGGAQALADTLARALTRAGGELALTTEIRRILCENGRAVGLETARGEKIAARRIIAAITPTRVFGEMLAEPLPSSHPYLKKLRSLKVSPSYFIAFLGAKTDDLGGSDIGNKEVFEHYDLETEYADLAEGRIARRGPFFVVVPSLAARDAVPDGRGQTVCLSVKAPYALRGGWTRQKRRELARSLLERATARCLPRLRPDDIETCATIAPPTIERLTGNIAGSPYGWAHIPGQVGLDRPGPDTPIRDLYLVGHWTRPGGGVASVLASARTLAERLLAR